MVEVGPMLTVCPFDETHSRRSGADVCCCLPGGARASERAIERHKMMLELVLFVLFSLTPVAALTEVRSWMDPSDPPAQRAAKLLTVMTFAEKTHFLHGSCSGYVGNVCGNDRLGIPAIKMNDGPQGFREAHGLPGTSTAWPCSLAIAATFDPMASGAWGTAMGDEFYRKGANVQLGPGVCLARVPRNGRNFEYISGEDPHLGYVMVQPVVQGIQSKGVVANAKHWVNNNQETDRSSVDEEVDERTRFEMYASLQRRQSA